MWKQQKHSKKLVSHTLAENNRQEGMNNSHYNIIIETIGEIRIIRSHTHTHTYNVCMCAIQCMHTTGMHEYMLVKLNVNKFEDSVWPNVCLYTCYSIETRSSCCVCQRVLVTVTTRDECLQCCRYCLSTVSSCNNTIPLVILFSAVYNVYTN